jgi:hypothetical protein
MIGNHFYSKNLFREPLNKSVVGIQPPEEVNYFVAPQGHFFGNASAIPQGAKLGNIPDIPCVLRLVFDILSALSARPGLVQRLLKCIYTWWNYAFF